MKRPVNIYIYILCIITSVLSSCCADEWTQSNAGTDLPVSIGGASYTPFSRSIPDGTEEQIPEGTSLSFFASGALSASNQILTLSDGTWQSADFPEWDSSQRTATISAFYPSLPTSGESFYQSDGKLSDILYDRQENVSQGNITLQFKHLFSKVTFLVSETLNAEVDSIAFTPSQSVGSIQTAEAQVLFSTDKFYTTTLTRQSDGSYSVIVPPAADMSIGITVYTTDGTALQAQLGSRTFEQGHEYRCAIKKNDSTEDAPGIYTVEDFIAFTHLINGTEYSGKTLADFGQLENGVMTYRLKNDLQFSSEQSKEIYILMNDTKSRFKDCFDGENHTLYNIEMPVQTVKRTLGLFSAIDTTGVVKNLRLDKFSYKLTTETQALAILCGINYGTIDNCHISNSTLTGNGTSKSVYRDMGGISYSNQGMICNSSCTNVTFTGKYDYFGGLVNVCSGGKLVNCYIANCTFTQTKGHSILVYQATNCNVYNCYSAGNKYSKTGVLVSKASKSTFGNCFYKESSVSTIGTDSGGNTTSFTSFTDDTATTVLGQLNEWTTTQGPTLFTGQTFMQWKAASDPPFLFADE